MIDLFPGFNVYCLAYNMNGALVFYCSSKLPQTWGLKVINSHLLSHNSANQKSRYSVAYTVVGLDSYRPKSNVGRACIPF